MIRQQWPSLLNPKKRYLQIALNGTLLDAQNIIASLPRNDRIILEAGTPFIKRYGQLGIAQVVEWYRRHLVGEPLVNRGEIESAYGTIKIDGLFKLLFSKKSKDVLIRNEEALKEEILLTPYVVADLKMMDRGTTEVEIAASAGAKAAVALGMAPPESLDAFIEACNELGIDAMIDMMNVEFPLSVLRKLKTQPRVVILHRGVDETERNKEKMLPLHEIRRVKGNYDVMVAVAGGDTPKEIQSAVFNDADIVIVWKSFYSATESAGEIARQFLEQIK